MPMRRARWKSCPWSPSLDAYGCRLLLWLWRPSKKTHTSFFNGEEKKNPSYRTWMVWNEYTANTCLFLVSAPSQPCSIWLFGETWWPSTPLTASSAWYPQQGCTPSCSGSVGSHLTGSLCLWVVLKAQITLISLLILLGGHLLLSAISPFK